MSNLTILPPSLLFVDPITGTIRNEWYMFLQQMFLRVGGSTASTNNDLAASNYEDAGIEEIKQGIYAIQDQLNSYLIAINAIQDELSSLPVSNYDASAIAETGGSIDGITIGATTASTGKFTTLSSGEAAQILNTTVAQTNYAAAAAGTLLNAPAAGNPVKWCAFNDNGTLRKFPTW